MKWGEDSSLCSLHRNQTASSLLLQLLAVISYSKGSHSNNRTKQSTGKGRATAEKLSWSCTTWHLEPLLLFPIHSGVCEKMSGCIFKPVAAMLLFFFSSCNRVMEIPNLLIRFLKILFLWVGSGCFKAVITHNTFGSFISGGTPKCHLALSYSEPCWQSLLVLNFLQVTYQDSLKTNTPF